MFQFSEIASSVVVEFVVSVIASAIGFLFARLIVARFEQWRFGGWKIVIVGVDGSEVVRRSIGVAKAKVILDDDADLSVFVKGIASPYGWLNADPVTVGREIGLFRVSVAMREMVVDLRRNPQKGAK